MAFAIGRIHVVEAALHSLPPQQGINTRSAGTDSQGRNDATSSNDLPIQPQITTALSIAGLILIFSGLAYLLTGSRTKRLHIFFLGEVSDKSGRHSTHRIRRDSSGIKCHSSSVPGRRRNAQPHFGGDFTARHGHYRRPWMSAWRLLRDYVAFGHETRALNDGSAAKAIFISFLTVAAYALFFSCWTREYALIALTSFSGATAVILGVDCFSGAGLKEFWLYIWGLSLTKCVITSPC